MVEKQRDQIDSLFVRYLKEKIMECFHVSDRMANALVEQCKTKALIEVSEKEDGRE